MVMDRYDLPSPDMAFGFDDAKDLSTDRQKAQREARIIVRYLALALRGVGIAVLIGAIIVAGVAAWSYLRTDIVTFVAPTAAEIAAPGFDLERKLAEVQP